MLKHIIWAALEEGPKSLDELALATRLPKPWLRHELYSLTTRTAGTDPAWAVADFSRVVCSNRGVYSLS